MSLILDALSRAEREKREREGAVPDMFNAAGGSPEPSGALRRWGLPLALAVALVLIAVLLFGGYVDQTRDSSPGSTPAGAGSPAAQRSADELPKGAEAQPAQRRTATDAVAQRPVAVPQFSGSGLKAGSGPTGAGEAGAIEALYARAAETDADASPDSETNTGAPSSRAASKAGPETAEAAAGEAESAEAAAADKAATVTEDPVDIQQVLRAVRAEANREALAAHPAPMLASLSKQFRDSVPTLMYLRHDYNAQGQSTVLINGQLLREGGRSRGVEILEILPDSVILRFAGQDFRLRSLNSWVNL